MRRDNGKLVSTIAQIGAYLLAIVLFFQLLRALFGGTWKIEDIILALVIFNLTITFGVGGYLISLNNKISGVNTKIEGHCKWHEGIDKANREGSKRGKQ